MSLVDFLHADTVNILFLKIKRVFQKSFFFGFFGFYFSLFLKSTVHITLLSLIFRIFSLFSK